MDDDSRREALALASELRAQGLRVDVYPDASRKFEKPLKYATGRNAPVLAILGENERRENATSVRNLQTREQTTVKRPDAAAYIASLLS